VDRTCQPLGFFRSQQPTPTPQSPHPPHHPKPQVSGQGDGVWGDCVVPLHCATLEGATNVVLEGVRHSMARIGSFDERPAGDQHYWYGSPQVGEGWGWAGIWWGAWGLVGPRGVGVPGMQLHRHTHEPHLAT